MPFGTIGQVILVANLNTFGIVTLATHIDEEMLCKCFSAEVIHLSQDVNLECYYTPLIHLRFSFIRKYQDVKWVGEGFQGKNCYFQESPWEKVTSILHPTYLDQKGKM